MMLPSPGIRIYTPQDHDPVTALLQRVCGDPLTAAYYRFGMRADPAGVLITIVAEAADRIVGVGSLWTNRMHPTTLYCGVISDPRYQGIDSALYHRLIQLRGRYATFPLQTAAWNTATPMIQFLQAEGFERDKCTYMPLIDLSQIHAAPDAAAVQRCSAAGYRVVSLAALPSSADRMQRLGALAAAIYGATHPSNPPAPLDPTEWARLIYDDSLEVAGSVVVLREHEFAGLGLLHVHEQPDHLAIGWQGVAAAYEQDEALIMPALISAEITYARQQGYRYLDAEIDTTDRWSMQLLSLIPTPPAEQWVTFRKPAMQA
jgi:hypothetical protein